MDNLPLISLDALVRGDAEAPIGGSAVILRYAQALAPQLTADLLALGTRLLPAPTDGRGAVPGEAAEPPLTRHNPIKRAAEQQFNELGSGEAVD